MDEAVITYYRHLLRDDFPNASSLDNPSIFVEAVGGKLINCGNTGNYMQLYLHVSEDRITEIKYLCACEPVANVAVEILCILAKGKTLDEVGGITEESFYRLLRSRDEALGKKAVGLLALLNEGIAGYRSQTGSREIIAKDGEYNWDGALTK